MSPSEKAVLLALARAQRAMVARLRDLATNPSDDLLGDIMNIATLIEGQAELAEQVAS